MTIAISIHTRIRNAMIGLSLVLCFVFTLILFGIVFTTEDQVFVNQLSAEKNTYEQHQAQFPGTSWASSNQRFQLYESVESLPRSLPQNDRERVAASLGIHEYYDSQSALFINHFQHSDTGASQFLIFDVSDFLAVRGNKLPIFTTIIFLTLFVTACAIFMAHRLVKRTLEPVTKFSRELQQGQLDDVVIELANEFSEDEIGVLTHQLATALEKVRDAAQREYEFNRGVSHELRSPIQVAQSAIELLELRTEKDDNSIGEYVRRLKRSTAEMNEITEAFLWLASDRHTKPSDVLSVTTIRKTVATILHMYPALELTIDSELAPDYSFPLPEKVGTVIVRNLLRNAISHGENELITLVLTERSISVINRASYNTAGTQGFGIGLAIVQRICERFECDFSAVQDQEQTHHASIVFKGSALTSQIASNG